MVSVVVSDVPVKLRVVVLAVEVMDVDEKVINVPELLEVRAMVIPDCRPVNVRRILVLFAVARVAGSVDNCEVVRQADAKPSEIVNETPAVPRFRLVKTVIPEPTLAVVDVRVPITGAVAPAPKALITVPEVVDRM